MINVKRVYEKYERSNGFRILIDRLWPRGVNKEKAKIDLWLKEIAPSHKLRKWFAHDPTKWPKFKKLYFKELVKKKKILEYLKELEKKNKRITLLYSAKDNKKNNAIALLEFINTYK